MAKVDVNEGKTSLLTSSTLVNKEGKIIEEENVIVKNITDEEFKDSELRQ